MRTLLKICSRPCGMHSLCINFLQTMPASLLQRPKKCRLSLVLADMQARAQIETNKQKSSQHNLRPYPIQLS